jgi:hypothetical protein
LKAFNENVTQIGQLHSKSLNNTDDAAAQRNAAQLDELVEDTSALSSTLKRRIKALEKQGGSGRDGQIRKQQVSKSVYRIMDRNLMSSLSLVDGPRKIEIRGSHPELPNCGATIPNTLQAENGTAVQNWRAKIPFRFLSHY